ncbi:hypothetical protein PEBR_05698 [Penicillium brasilianum]|uniref:Zn(2)-C6 fungal-type domain-containing protein n=1 Tax=Penicillium brasilianum TaxID=104259 RepID=A0A1S9RZ61_PENBI|nr:hypothetical protein PEBR_05698 [Penicillium brasilianum]
MPNNRGPSKGCQRCRELKVKCDENRPSCSRCQKGNHECAYRSQFDLFHRNQNTVAQVAATKKWRQRADIEPSVNTIEISIPKALGPPLSELAYNRLYFDFVNPWPGTLGRLRHQLRETAPNSCLVSVVAAVAYANFYGRCNSQEAKKASSVHYGLALQRLATTMTDAKEMQRDEVLMVIWLMGMYEMLTSGRRDGSWITHMLGTQSVIAQRDNTNFTNGDYYLAILCMNLVIYYLNVAKPPPAQLRHWIQRFPFPMDLRKRLAVTMADAASTCSELRERTKCRTANFTEKLISADLVLVQEALAIDLRLQSWCHSSPPEWSPVSIHPVTSENRSSWTRELLASPGAPEYATSYSNRLAACDWNMCRATRLSLQLEIISFISTFHSPNLALSTIKSHSLDLIITLTDEIAYSVPFALDISPNGTSDPASSDQIPGLSAYRILWPIFTSSMCFRNELVRSRDLAQRAQWFQTILRFLRDSMGIAKVDVFLGEQSVDA